MWVVEIAFSVLLPFKIMRELHLDKGRWAEDRTNWSQLALDFLVAALITVPALLMSEYLADKLSKLVLK